MSMCETPPMTPITADRSPTLQQGMFIVFDGCDGAGKTTQIRSIKSALETSGYQVITTREPGGSPGGEEIRNLVVKGEPGRWDGITEALLFSAARRNHIQTVIKPALDAGKIVLCDRFIPSTFAYQGYGQGIPLDVIESVTRLAVGDFKPDLTFIFLMDPDVALHRANQRAGVETRFESFGNSFQQRVAEGYHRFIKDHAHWVGDIIPVDVVINDDLPVIESIAAMTNALLKLIRVNHTWLSRLLLENHAILPAE